MYNTSYFGNIRKIDRTKYILGSLNKMWKNIETFMLENADKNIVLLCYEKPPKFCHIHLLASFFEC